MWFKNKTAHFREKSVLLEYLTFTAMVTGYLICQLHKPQKTHEHYSMFSSRLEDTLMYD
jgi:hypothetical protein